MGNGGSGERSLARPARPVPDLSGRRGAPVGGFPRRSTPRRNGPRSAPGLGAAGLPANICRARRRSPAAARSRWRNACPPRRAALRWGQTYTEADFGRDFLDRYGWTELVGTRGHFASETIAAGFLLLGPGVVYPDHHHVAEEIYVPLTPATEWRKGDGAFVARAAGEVIHHPSNVSHAMRTGAEPLLALYLWRGGPLAQKSIVTGTSGREA